MLESLFNNITALRPATFLKRNSNIGVFSVNIGKFLRRLFLHITSGLLLLLIEFLYIPASGLKTCNFEMCNFENVLRIYLKVILAIAFYNLTTKMLAF